MAAVLVRSCSALWWWHISYGEAGVQVGAGLGGGHWEALGMWHSTGHVVLPGPAEPSWAHRALAADDVGLELTSVLLCCAMGSPSARPRGVPVPFCGEHYAMLCGGLMLC